jgi:hypothetical protein
MILSFLKWNKLNEARDREQILANYRENFPEMEDAAEAMNFLIDTNIIDSSGYDEDFKKMRSAFNKWTKQIGLNPREKEDLQIYLELLKKMSAGTTRVAIDALSSDAAKSLFDLGLHLVSSPAQLMNGNLIFSLDPQYRRLNGWGIGFFPGPKRIRRMTPKGIYLNVWGRGRGSMDIGIKQFNNITSDTEFFDVALKWAANNIDFGQAASNPDPTAWKYYTKRKTRTDAHNKNAD